MKKSICLAIITISTLFSGEPFKFIEAGLEYTLLKINKDIQVVSLQEALREQINGVEDPYFNEEFIEKVVEAAKNSPAGEYIDYFSDGKIRVRVPYRNGFINGHVHGWYDSGADAFKGHYKDGIRQGIHMTFFYEKDGNYGGNYQRILFYNDEGLLHGVQSTHYSSSEMESSLHYNRGVLDGNSGLYENKYVPPIRTYIKRSYMAEERLYRNGVLKSVKTYSNPVYINKTCPTPVVPE
jgi:antitoxin component YwqK of YwqJK toxin-antitoxin module